MRFVVVTGMSGSGKTTALKFLEDSGFYCVDNIPVALVETFLVLASEQNSELSKLALGIDVRSGQSFNQLDETILNLKEKGYPIEVLFMDSDDNSLMKRYKETRRSHPLMPEGRIEDGVLLERKILSDMRNVADYVLDTTNLLTRELKSELQKIFIENEEYKNLMITVMSFGFKHGIPSDADLVFDVRFLPNPFYIDDLKAKTGNDKEVSDYVMKFPESAEFLSKLEDMVQFLIPNYIKEGKTHLVIAIGCTGGKHRSVTLANALYENIKKGSGYGVTIVHRDVLSQSK